MARRFIITHPDGTTLNLVSTKSVSYVSSAQLESQFQGTDSVKLKVVSAVPLSFYIGDTIELWGITYTINQLPKASQDGNRSYEYELTFEGLQYELISRVFILVGLDAMYDSLTGTIEDFMDVLISNMKRDATHAWSWKAYNAEGIGTGETLTETFNDKNCLEVLQQLMTDFECEFKIQQNSDGSRTIIVGSEGELAEDSLAGYVFEYGLHGGAYELKREPADNTNIITRLFCYGGSSNLNTLGNVYPYTRLLLPDTTRDTSYLEDKDMQHLYGVTEGIQTFDDIVPCCKGQIAELASSENGNKEFYAYKSGAEAGDDYNIDFNPLDYLIADTTAKITMQTGELAGYSFEVLDGSCKSENDKNGHMYFHIKAFSDENGMVFPYQDGSAFNFRVGDEFLLENIYLPIERIRDAEEKLKEKAQESFDETKMPQIKYSLTIDQQWLKHYFDPYNTGVDYSAFECGNLVHVKASPLDIDDAIRINSLTRNLLNDYDITLTLADKTTPSIINRIIGAMETQKEIIKIGDLTNAQKARQNWYTMQEVLNMVFDVEGNYYSEKIAPESIETMMLSVGARSQQFTLQGVSFFPNYGSPADPNTIYNTGGFLEHFTIEPDSVVTWQIQEQTAELKNTEAYYVYACCPREFSAGAINAGGLIVYLQLALTFEGNYVDDNGNKQTYDTSNYYFLVGTLTSVYDSGNGYLARDFVPTYGNTTINGRFITTGRITANDGNTYFDLDTGEIHGVITFTNEEGVTYNVQTVLEEAQATANEAYQDAINAGKGVDEAMAQAKEAYDKAVEVLDEYAYLKKALPDGSQTVVDGGLVLSNLICVSKYGDSEETQASSVVAGMAGCDTRDQDGEGVCFWAGEVYSKRTEAPFVVYEDGTVNMTQANIQSTDGEIGTMLLTNGMISFINDDSGGEKAVTFTSDRWNTLADAGLGIASGGGSTYYMYAQKAEMSNGTISETTIFSGTITSPTTGTLTYPQKDFGGTMVLNVTSRGYTLTFVYNIYVTVNGTRYHKWWEGTLDYDTEGATKTVNCITSEIRSIPVNKGDSIKVEFSVEQTLTYRDGSSGGSGYASYDFPQLQLNISGGEFASHFFSNGIVLQADGNAGFGVLPEAVGSSNPQFYMGDTYGNAFRLCNNIFSIRAGSNSTNVWRDATPMLLWSATLNGGTSSSAPTIKNSFSPLGIKPTSTSFSEQNTGYLMISLGVEFDSTDDYIVLGSTNRNNNNSDAAWFSVAHKYTSSFIFRTIGGDNNSSIDPGTTDIAVYALKLDI